MYLSTWLGSMPLNKNVKKKKLSEYKNNSVFMNELSKNVIDALSSRYTFEGLPDTVNERVLKSALLRNGCAFFFEKEGSLMCLPGLPDGSGVNVMGDFSGAYVYGANGFSERISLFLPGSDKNEFLNRTLNSENSEKGGVMVRENYLLYPFLCDAIYYAERQADTLRKIEVACKNAATPYLVVAEESVIPTVKKYFDDRDSNLEYIISSGIFPADKVSLLPFSIQADSIKCMTAAYEWYCNRFREKCGIKSSTNLDKKGENLTNAEISISDDYTNLTSQSVIKVIQEGLDIVNDLYHTVITVREINDNIQRDTRKTTGLPGSDTRRSEGDD